MRRLQVETDQAVVVAYGWQDLDLGHGFNETKQGIRYTISESARREVLDRLLELNHNATPRRSPPGCMTRRRLGQPHVHHLRTQRVRRSNRTCSG